MKNLPIFTCATSSFCHTLEACGRHIARAFLASGKRFEKATWVLVGDDSSDFGPALSAWAQTGQGHSIVRLKVQELGQFYKKERQISIARLQQAGLDECRRLGFSHCLSVESDTLIASNSIRCMYDSLLFDDGYYSISTCPYPSQGGGAFLGGRGTFYSQISEDFLIEERIIPKKLLKAHKECKDLLKRKKPSSQEEANELSKKYAEIMDEIKKCPPRGNIWQLNSKKWRKRGWLDFAYPACSKGMMLPTDWCGMGCTMMNWEALCAADFTGYEGGGTQDLHLVWNCWYPKGLKINVLPHSLAHHVIRAGEDGKESKVMFSYHAPPEDGEVAGHLRFIGKEWINY